MEQLNPKQFVWAYLLENGYEVAQDAQYSYYGGFRRLYDDYRSWAPKAIEAEKLRMDKIANIGINWEATQDPVGESHSEFVGTFCDSDESEWLDGLLVLNDGSVRRFVGKDKAGMGSYIERVRAFMNSQEKAKDFLKRFIK